MFKEFLRLRLTTYEHKKITYPLKLVTSISKPQARTFFIVCVVVTSDMMS